MHSYKQSAEEILIKRAVKTTIKVLHDKGLFDWNDNAVEVLKDYLNIEGDERRRPSLDPINDIATKWAIGSAVVNHWFFW